MSPADDDSPAELAMGADLADAVDLLAVAWPAGDYDDDTDLDAPVYDHLAYGCDNPECVICDGTEEAWS